MRQRRRFISRVAGHIWSLPNTLLGLLFGVGGVYSLDRANRVVVVCGGAAAAVFRRFGFAGMCIGDVVLSYEDLQRRYPHIYRHELVHATQARILGPLYLPATLMGYALGLVLSPRCPHDGSPLEIWADIASGNADSNAFLKRWRRGRYLR